VTRAGKASKVRFDQLPKLVKEELDAKLKTVDALEDSHSLLATDADADAATPETPVSS